MLYVLLQTRWCTLDLLIGTMHEAGTFVILLRRLTQRIKSSSEALSWLSPVRQSRCRRDAVDTDCCRMALLLADYIACVGSLSTLFGLICFRRVRYHYLVIFTDFLQAAAANVQMQ